MGSLNTEDLARHVRSNVLRMLHKAQASHAGSCLSIADVLAVLYGRVMSIDSANPSWSERDRFILSKGHAAAAVYAVLAESGFFPRSMLDTYCDNCSQLGGHITAGVPGVEVSTGSLGHGLPIACGVSLAGKRDGRGFRVYALLSDGECDEGSVWEAILFAAHHHLDNLVAIVDYNKIQSFGSVDEVLGLEPFADKWKAFGWSCREIDGHDHQALKDTLGSIPFQPGKPSVIIAHTTKGKGVSFMEHQLAWHYRSPNDEELRQALGELGAEK